MFKVEGPRFKSGFDQLSGLKKEVLAHGLGARLVIQNELTFVGDTGVDLYDLKPIYACLWLWPISPHFYQIVQNPPL